MSILMLVVLKGSLVSFDCLTVLRPINQSINQSYSETRSPKEQSDCNSAGRDVHTHTFVFVRMRSYIETLLSLCIRTSLLATTAVAKF